MPQKIKDADGNEIDVFTAAEVAEQAEAKAKELTDARVAEETERLQTEKESELLEKDEELKEAKEKLEKLEKKDMNFENLRKKADKRTDEENKVFDEMKSLRATVENIQKQPLETARAQFVAQNIGEDKDLKEKFDFFYGKLSAGAKTIDEVNQALVAAHAAATEGKRPLNTTNRMTHTGVDDDFANMDTNQESEDSQEFGRMLGLTPEDKKKFGPAAKSGSVPLFANTSPAFSKKND